CTKRMPSVAPCPVVPIMVIADSWVAMAERPTAHQGRLRLARKYPEIPVVPRARRTPSKTTYVSHAPTITQFSGCTEQRNPCDERPRCAGSRSARSSRRKPLLQEPQQKKCDGLHTHHADQRAPEARGVGSGGHTLVVLRRDAVAGASVSASPTMRACSLICV